MRKPFDESLLTEKQRDAFRCIQTLLSVSFGAHFARTAELETGPANIEVQVLHLDASSKKWVTWGWLNLNADGTVLFSYKSEWPEPDYYPGFAYGVVHVIQSYARLLWKEACS